MEKLYDFIIDSMAGLEYKEMWKVYDHFKNLETTGNEVVDDINCLIKNNILEYIEECEMDGLDYYDKTYI